MQFSPVFLGNNACRGWFGNIFILLIYFLHIIVLLSARLSIPATSRASKYVSADGKIIFKALFCIVLSLFDQVPDIDCHTGTAYSKIGRIIVR